MKEPPIERILFTEEQMDQRVRQVAAEISLDYAGRELKLIGVLKGSVFFLTALARELAVPAKVDFLAISSFANQKGAPGMVRIAKDLDDSIEGEDILLVEDIVDTGFHDALPAAAPGRPRAEFAGAFARCSTGPREESCRCPLITVVLRFRTGSWWAAVWITGSCIAILKYIAVLNMDPPAEANSTSAPRRSSPTHTSGLPSDEETGGPTRLSCLHSLIAELAG